MTRPDRLAAYASEDGATEYLEEYEKSHRKLSDRRERRLLQKYRTLMGPPCLVLDLPCGWGRYLSEFRSQGSQVLQSDWSGEMLSLGRTLFGEESAFGRFRSLGDCIPLPDRAVDLAFSMRLNHHLKDQSMRERHLCELFRVSSQWAIFSYFDHGSLKAKMRRWRRALGDSKREKFTLKRGRVHELANQAGWQIQEDPLLFAIGSGHRLVLAKKKD